MALNPNRLMHPLAPALGRVRSGASALGQFRLGGGRSRIGGLKNTIRRKSSPELGSYEKRKETTTWAHRSHIPSHGMDGGSAGVWGHPGGPWATSWVISLGRSCIERRWPGAGVQIGLFVPLPIGHKKIVAHDGGGGQVARDIR